MKRRHLYFICCLFAFVRLNVFSSAFRRNKASKIPKDKLSTSNKIPGPVLMPQIGSQSHHPTSAPRSTRTRFDFTYLPDVSVSCSTSDIVVRVKPSFYGFGADESELKLGSSCRSNGVLRPYGDFIFTYPLTACDPGREVTRDFLVYRYTLHYEPSNQTPLIDVGIECRYQRYHHVYQLAVKPTWQTALVRKNLKTRQNEFLIQLMDDSWNNPVKHQVYQLGQKVHIQVSAPHLQTGRKLYINSCHASIASGSSSSQKYTIIGHLGCMLDSKRDPGGASQFISHTNKTLRFSFKAFQFNSDPDKEINIHCKVFVTSEEPGPARKSCTYRQGRWRALSGDDSICECCNSRCVNFKSQKNIMKGSVRSALLVADQPLAEEGLLAIRRRNHPQHQNHGVLQQNADLLKYDKEEYDGGERLIRESALEKFPQVRETSEESISNEFEEKGSGYEVDNLKEEQEGQNAGQLGQVNPTKGEALHEWLQPEQMLASQVTEQGDVQHYDAKGDEEKRNRTNGTEEAARTKFSEVHNNDEQGDDKDLIWYFSWR